MSIALSQRVEEGQGIEPCTVAMLPLYLFSATHIGATLLVVLGLRSTEMYNLKTI